MKRDEKGFGVSGGVAVEVGRSNTYGFFFWVLGQNTETQTLFEGVNNSASRATYL